MSITVEQFVAELGWDIDSTEFKEFQGQIDKAAKDLKRLTQIVVGAGAAITTMAIATNEATARQTRLAQSVGASAETIAALSHVMGGLGFDADHVIDLVEEMSNKFGELKGLGTMTSATDALKMLRLEFEEIRDLAPEEQFIKVLDAAKELADQQEAVSAVDMLMGGEGNKIMGFLRTRGGTLSDLITQVKALSLLTEEGRQGAIHFSDQWRALTFVGKSFVQEFSGAFGEVITPLVEETVDWAVANKELIHSKAVDWAESFAEAIKDIGEFLRTLNGYVQQMGGYETTIKRIGFAFAAWRIGGLVSSVSKLAAGLDGIGAAGLAGSALASGGLNLLHGGLVGLIALLAQDIWVSLNGGESGFSDIAEAVADAAGEVDKFIAGMLGIPVDEFRAGMLDTFDAIGRGYAFVDEVLGEVGNKVLWFTATSLDAFGQWGDSIWMSLQAAQDKAIDGLKSFGADVLAWLADLAKSVGSGLADMLGSKIMGIAGDVADGMRNLVGVTPKRPGVNLVAPSPSNVQSTNVNNDNRQYTLAPSATVNGAPAGSTGTAREMVYQLEDMLSQSVATLGG